MGVGINYSKPFVCICKHTATRIPIWRGCPAEVGNLTVSVSWPSALHCIPCRTPCSPGNVPTPTPITLMAITPVNTGQQLYIVSARVSAQACVSMGPLPLLGHAIMSCDAPFLALQSARHRPAPVSTSGLALNVSTSGLALNGFEVLQGRGRACVQETC